MKPLKDLKRHYVYLFHESWKIDDEVVVEALDCFDAICKIEAEVVSKQYWTRDRKYQSFAHFNLNADAWIYVVETKEKLILRKLAHDKWQLVG